MLLFAGCGGNVSVEGNGGAGGAGTGSGGAGAGSGGGSSTTLPNGGAGGATQLCGGKEGATCNPDAWCNYPASSSCGCCDATGVCEPRPLDCPPDCPGACGCDGQFYCNDCLANLAGVDVDPDGTCDQANTEYSAHLLPTGAPRLVILKADSFRNICVRVTAVGFGDSSMFAVGVTPPWQVESIVLTDHASDCAIAPSGFPEVPLGQSVEATAAQGKIDLDPSDVPCGLTADATLFFAPDAPWIPDQEPFDSGYLSTGIACDP